MQLRSPLLTALPAAEADELLSVFVAFCFRVKHLQRGTIDGKLKAVRYYHLQETGVKMAAHPLTTQALAAVAKQGKNVQHKAGVFLADIVAFSHCRARGRCGAGRIQRHCACLLHAALH